MASRAWRGRGVGEWGWCPGVGGGGGAVSGLVGHSLGTEREVRVGERHARNRAKPLRDKSTTHIFADSSYSRAREDTAWIDPVESSSQSQRPLLLRCTPPRRSPRGPAIGEPSPPPPSPSHPRASQLTATSCHARAPAACGTLPPKRGIRRTTTGEAAGFASRPARRGLPRRTVTGSPTHRPPTRVMHRRLGGCLYPRVTQHLDCRSR